jgi:hypothetical protein
MLLIFPLIGFNSIYELSIINRGKEISLSVRMTIGHCHSEGVFDDWRMFACRNDNRPLSFWRNFLWLKNLSLSEWQNATAILKELFVTEESFLCRNDNRPLSFWRSFSWLKNLCLSEWQNATVILKELFATEGSLPVGITMRFLVEVKNLSVGITTGHCHSEGAFCDWRIFACRNYEEIPRRSKNSFSVGMTKRYCHSEGAFRDWRVFACWKYKGLLTK